MKNRENATLNYTKSIYAIFIITFVMSAVVAVIFVLYITNLKKSLDEIYSHYVLPTNKIVEISQFYSANLFYDINQKNSSEIKNLLDSIQTKWDEYRSLSRYYGKSEFEDLQKIELEKAIEANLQNILILANDTGIVSLQDIKNQKEQIYLALQVSAEDFNKLFSYFLDELNKQKSSTDEFYKKWFYRLFGLIFIIFMLCASTVVFLGLKSKQINKMLDSMVKTKTYELQNLNKELEAKLKRELENSRKKDQAILMNSKMAALGEMLRNVSHQWRQPLNAIIMIIQSFETKLEKGKLTQEFVSSQVKEALILANGMSKTLDEFGSFYSPNKQKRSFELDELIQNSLTLSRYILDKNNIKLTYEKQDGIRLFTYKNELLQVLINIINNAKDALNDKFYTKYIIIKTYIKDNFAIIDIADNGGGIKDGVIEKIFEPYFTTKHQSMGSGIGLYMSKNLIEKHIGGELLVTNITKEFGPREYRGANFIIKIPMMED
ncbi:MAG: HAMP domain-containing histidine kinase [Campylobacter sp.]|nr:HAMP domain-containing histidine kinase [Campylobacter sp.]